MVREKFSITFDEDTIENIDVVAKSAEYFSRNAFIRVAVREKLEVIKVK